MNDKTDNSFVSECSKSSMCQSTTGFCNFDYGDAGFCESCDDIGGPCDQAGFITQRGEDECTDVCGGMGIVQYIL